MKPTNRHMADLVLAVAALFTLGCSDTGNAQSGLADRVELLSINTTVRLVGLVLGSSEVRAAQNTPGPSPGISWQVRNNWPIVSVTPYQDDDECCSDPGQISECWWEDADRDGVTCSASNPCPDSRNCITADTGPQNQGLCECTKNEDCYDGDTLLGVCTSDGLCGPSYCNGYMRCSCWGGCIEARWKKDDEDGYYENPMQRCKDMIGSEFCCEGLYPKTVGTGLEGYCSPAADCGTGPGEDDGGVPIGECSDHADCDAYAGNVCVNGFCGAGNTCFYTKNDAPEYVCANGTAIDPSTEICCCDADDECPNEPCIDEANSSCDLNPGNLATYFQCDLEHDDTGDSCAGEGTPPKTDDTCHSWRCNADAAKDCISYNEPENTACDDATHVNTDCGVWHCEDVAGTMECVFNTVLQEKQSCDTAPVPTDVCAKQYCDTSGNCSLGKAEGDVCPPDGSTAYTYQEMYCNAFHCNAGQVCAPDTPLFTPTPVEREDCTSHASDDLGDVSAGDLLRTEDSICADDDFDVAGSADNPRFNSCDFEDFSDFAYYYDGKTSKTEFVLNHVLIEAKENPAGPNEWDPVVYAKSSCDNLPGSQYTCNDDCDFSNTSFNDLTCGVDVGVDDAVVTAGPWPVRDIPEFDSSMAAPVNDWDSNGMDDGFRTENDWEGWVVVDSAASTPPYPPGGTFDLVLEYNEHNNNSCWDTSSFVAAPFIAGQQVWKERWRGTTQGYQNFICQTAGPNPNVEDADGSDNCLDDTTNMQIASGCWTGNDADVALDDPGQAFFRVDLPEGKYKIYTDEAGMMWSADGYKEWIFSANKAAHAGTPYEEADFMSVVLAQWGGGASSEGICIGALDPNSSSTKCMGGTIGWPRERIYDNDAAGWHGWLEVSNNEPNKRGDYEVNIVKVFDEFLGFSAVYSGSGGSSGCGCSSPTGYWPMEGYRLDMVPTNDPVIGFSINSKAVSTGPDYWAVDPSLDIADGALKRVVECEGDTGANNCLRTMGPFELPFQMPYSGGFYGYYCLNSAGRIDLRESASDPCEAWDRDPSSKKITGQHDDPDPQTNGYAPMVFPLWGEIIPCWKSNRQPATLYGSDDYNWISCRTGGEGRITRQTVPFEGTVAEVITWDGFDGSVHPSTDRADRRNSLQFQVILRIDGRITFYFKQPAQNSASPNSAWDKILAYNGWSVGLSGTRTGYCADFAPDPDADTFCNNQLGGTTLVCDDENETTGAPNNDIIYEARDFCMNRVDSEIEAGISGP
ncbi:MAG: hypothetical protein GY847_10615 [Proteobacteria bacterium]|nr:hypothetical protein [Pseudomonadota bacterium]